MPQQSSFDVTTGVDLQEVDNAVNQAQKEISQRYDFKGSPATIEFNRGEGKITLTAENDYKMNALWDVLQSKLIRRGVSVKNLDAGEINPLLGLFTSGEGLVSEVAPAWLEALRLIQRLAPTSMITGLTEPKSASCPSMVRHWLGKKIPVDRSTCARPPTGFCASQRSLTRLS